MKMKISVSFAAAAAAMVQAGTTQEWIQKRKRKLNSFLAPFVIQFYQTVCHLHLFWKDWNCLINVALFLSYPHKCHYYMIKVLFLF